MRFMKISYQILLVFVVVIVICLGISGWFLLQISENIIINKISDGDTQLAPDFRTFSYTQMQKPIKIRCCS